MKRITLLVIADSWHHFEKPIKEYEKRLQKELEIICLKPSKYDDIHLCRERDTKNMLEALKKYPHAYKVLCDIGGKSLWNTEAFAQWFNQKSQNNKGIVFIIGGSYGLDVPLLESEVQELISFTPWTLPHALAVLVLIEQLYRIDNFLAGGKYHH